MSLQIPDRYTDKKVLEETTFRRIEEYVCDYKEPKSAYGRTIHAYYHKPDGELMALKYLCMVRVLQDRGPCYSFCQLTDGSTNLELYMDFDNELLEKVINAHYPGLSVKDFSFCPGSPYIFYSSIFRDHCVLLFPTGNQEGKALELNESMPIDYLHYY